MGCLGARSIQQNPRHHLMDHTFNQMSSALVFCSLFCYLELRWRCWHNCKGWLANVLPWGVGGMSVPISDLEDCRRWLSVGFRFKTSPNEDMFSSCLLLAVACRCWECFDRQGGCSSGHGRRKKQSQESSRFLSSGWASLCTFTPLLSTDVEHNRRRATHPWRPDSFWGAYAHDLQPQPRTRAMLQINHYLLWS